MGNRITRVLFAVLLIASVAMSFSPASAFAQGKKDPVSLARQRVDFLLAQRHRPTVQDVVNAVGDYPEALYSSRAGDVARQQRTIRASVEPYLAQTLPTAVVFLEAFYPNGTYATLGRDAFLIADMLEAFYLSLGVPDRVRRLGASTSTFQSLAAGRGGMGLKFLKSNGLDIGLAAARVRPYVIIDRTSYGPGSQSTQLIEAVFNAPEVTKAQVAQLMTTVNVVSTNTGDQYSLSPAGVAKFLQTNSAKPRDHWNMSATQTLGIPRHLNLAVLSPLTDKTQLNWHSGFNADLEVADDNQTLAGVPGNEEGDHRLTLQTMWALYEGMREFGARERVWRFARESGFDIEQRIISESKMPEIRLREIRYLRLARIVTQDLETVFTHSEWEDLGEEGQQIVNFFGVNRERTWSADLSSEIRQSGAQAARIYNQRRKLLMAARADAPAFSRFGKLGFELILDLPPLDLVNISISDHSKNEQGDKTYFSANAQRINDLFKSWRKAMKPTTADSSDLIRLVDVASKREVITSKDARRLLLVALANVEKIDKRTIALLSEAIGSSSVSREILADKPTVFMTSKKFNSGRNKAVYAALLESGVLPKSAECQELLKAKDKDTDEGE